MNWWINFDNYNFLNISIILSPMKYKLTKFRGLLTDFWLIWINNKLWNKVYTLSFYVLKEELISTLTLFSTLSHLLMTDLTGPTLITRTGPQTTMTSPICILNSRFLIRAWWESVSNSEISEQWPVIRTPAPVMKSHLETKQVTSKSSS